MIRWAYSVLTDYRRRHIVVTDGDDGDDDDDDDDEVAGCLLPVAS